MSKIIDNKYILVKNDYYLCNKKRRFVKVRGKKIVIKHFEDFEFFFCTFNKEVIICEAFTGTKVNIEDGTFVKVFKSTSELLLKTGAVELRRIFTLMMKITKLSPRYKHLYQPKK